MGIFDRRKDQLSAPLFQYALDHCGDVHEQMESIGNLLCLRCAQGGAFSVQTSAITRDGGDLRMLHEPLGETLSGSIR